MLPKPNRLRQRSDFAALRREGRKMVFPEAVIITRPNQEAISRFAFVASRRVGGAVRRNLAKRRLREAVRLRLCDFPPGYDFLILARGKTTTAPMADLNDIINGVINRLERLGKTDTRPSSGRPGASHP